MMTLTISAGAGTDTGQYMVYVYRVKQVYTDELIT